MGSSHTCYAWQGFRHEAPPTSGMESFPLKVLSFKCNEEGVCRGILLVMCMIAAGKTCCRQVHEPTIWYCSGGGGQAQEDVSRL